MIVNEVFLLLLLEKKSIGREYFLRGYDINVFIYKNLHCIFMTTINEIIGVECLWIEKRIEQKIGRTMVMFVGCKIKIFEIQIVLVTVVNSAIIGTCYPVLERSIT